MNKILVVLLALVIGLGPLSGVAVAKRVAQDAGVTPNTGNTPANDEWATDALPEAAVRTPIAGPYEMFLLVVFGPVVALALAFGVYTAVTAMREPGRRRPPVA